MPMVESNLNPTARSYTALFRVLATLMPSTKQGSANKVIYAVNHPGQNTWECYTLAGLTFVMLMGYFTILIGELLCACPGSYLLGFLIALGLTFIALHAVFIVFALGYHALKAIRFLPPSAPPQVPLAVHLFAVTLFALALLFSGKVVWMLIAMPWVIGLALNFVCALMLFLRDFITQIQGGESES